MAEGPTEAKIGEWLFDGVKGRFLDGSGPNIPATFTAEDMGRELASLPPEQTGGRTGFFQYETECPSCGEELEGVLKEGGPEGATG